MRPETNLPQRPNRLSIAVAAAVLVGLAPATSAWAQIAAPAVVDGPSIDVKRYVIDGDLPLSEAEIATLLAPYVGEKRSLRHIEGAAAVLEQAVRTRGFAFHRLYVPAQKPVDGVVRLQVVSFKLGTVEVTGDEHFSTANIRRSLTGLVEGQVPEVRTIGRDVTASNANPAKQTTVTFKEGRQPSTVDAVARVRDTPPISYFATLTGNQSLAGNGPQANTFRLGGGFQHANLFDRDHVMTLSYTTDPGRVSSVSLLGAYYQLPLYGTGMNLAGYYTSSDVSSGTVQQGGGVFDVSGSGRFWGVRLSKVLPRFSALQQTVSVSLDSRFFENSTTFGGVKISPDVGARTVSLQYLFNTELSWGELAGNLDYVTNVGGGSGNNDAAYLANGGTRRWDAWRGSLVASMQSGGWRYMGRLKGQYWPKSLISGEQFGLGGANSVRGFGDRVVSGDHGFQWNLEASAPAFSTLQLRPVMFLEGGQVHTRSTGFTETVMSVGAGLRLTRQNLQLGMDVAKVLERNSTEPPGNPVRLHFAVTYRF